MLLTCKGSCKDEVRDRLIAYIEYKLDLTRPDGKSRRKTRIKGYNRTLKYSNGLELQFLTCTVTWVFLVDMSGLLCEDFSTKGWTDRQVVNVLDWDINDVFNDSTTQELTTPSHDAVDLAIDYYNARI